MIRSPGISRGTASCEGVLNDNPVNGSYIRTLRVREFQSDDPDDPYGVVLKPVKRDPDNHENPLGVPLESTDQGHPAWKESSLFCGESVPEAIKIGKGGKVLVPESCWKKWGSIDEYGDHVGYIYGERTDDQTIKYPENWKIPDIYIPGTDDCYAVYEVHAETPLKRISNCIDKVHALGFDYGHQGFVGPRWESESITWFNRVWRVKDGVYPRFERLIPDQASEHDAYAQWLKPNINNKLWSLDKVHQDQYAAIRSDGTFRFDSWGEDSSGYSLCWDLKEKINGRSLRASDFPYVKKVLPVPPKGKPEFIVESLGEKHITWAGTAPKSDVPMDW